MFTHNDLAEQVGHLVIKLWQVDKERSELAVAASQPKAEAAKKDTE